MYVGLCPRAELLLRLLVALPLSFSNQKPCLGADRGCSTALAVDATPLAVLHQCLPTRSSPAEGLLLLLILDARKGSCYARHAAPVCMRRARSVSSIRPCNAAQALFATDRHKVFSVHRVPGNVCVRLHKEVLERAMAMQMELAQEHARLMQQERLGEHGEGQLWRQGSTAAGGQEGDSHGSGHPGPSVQGPVQDAQHGGRPGGEDGGGGGASVGVASAKRAVRAEGAGVEEEGGSSGSGSKRQKLGPAGGGATQAGPVPGPEQARPTPQASSKVRQPLVTFRYVPVEPSSTAAPAAPPSSRVAVAGGGAWPAGRRACRSRRARRGRRAWGGRREEVHGPQIGGPAQVEGT